MPRSRRAVSLFFFVVVVVGCVECLVLGRCVLFVSMYPVCFCFTLIFFLLARFDVRGSNESLCVCGKGDGVSGGRVTSVSRSLHQCIVSLWLASKSVGRHMEKKRIVCKL